MYDIRQEQQLLAQAIATLERLGFAGLFAGLRREGLCLEALAAEPCLAGLVAGCEAEAFVSQPGEGGALVPVCVPAWLREQGASAEHQLILPPFGTATIEAGDNMMELIGLHSDSILEAWQRVARMAAELAGRGLRLDFCSSRPDYGPGHPAKVAVKGPRYQGLIEGIRATKGEEGVRLFVELLTTSSALHWHFSGIPIEAMIEVFNLLTRLAPFFEAAVGPLFGAPPRRGSQVWGSPDDPATQWAPAEYLPDLREFPSWAAKLEQLERMPQFLDEHDRPSFEARGLTKALLKCIWWPVRWSRHGTLECRFNSSVPPVGMCVAAALMLIAIRAAILRLPVRHVSVREWREAF